jgi:glyoxylase-like metal-dependent hydrolase (beta-lactamase superfamily II)
MTGLLVDGRALVAGDSLFADGSARPGLQHGDPEGAHALARTLHATLRERILSLGDDVVDAGMQPFDADLETGGNSCPSR